MANLRPVADQMHQGYGSLLRVLRGCLNSARFCSSSSSCGVGGRGGGLPSSSRSSSEFPISVRYGIDLPSVRSSVLALFPWTQHRCFSSPPLAAGDYKEAVTERQETPPSSPWLMLPTGLLADHQQCDDYFQLYNILDKKVRKIWRNNNLRLPWERKVLSQSEAICIGSSHGWLAFIHPCNCSLYLLNPLLMVVVDSSSSSSSSDFPYLPLPPVETLSSVISSITRRKDDEDPSSVVTEYMSPYLSLAVSTKELSRRFIRKLVLSSAPFPFHSNHHHHDSQEITVMTIQGNVYANLAFCRLGDTAWTSLDGPLGSYRDLVYFTKDQRFYALSYSGSVEAWDLSDPTSPKCTLIISSLPPLVHQTMDEHQRCLRNRFRDLSTMYLAESSGDLLLVFRYFSHSVDDNGTINLEINQDFSRPHKTVQFDVYKLDFVHTKWEYVSCLGDEALFIGENHSVSLSASNFPGLRKNSIYFTCLADAWMNDNYGGHDLGVFNLEDGNIRPFFQCHLKKIQPPPIWIIPR